MYRYSNCFLKVAIVVPRIEAALGFAEKHNLVCDAILVEMYPNDIRKKTSILFVVMTSSFKKFKKAWSKLDCRKE